MYKRSLGKDVSYEFYQKYFSLTNKLIEITLRDDTKCTAEIIGYFYNTENCSPYICKWHITTTESFLGIGVLDSLEGRILCHQEINSILILEDNSLWKF